MKTFTSLRKNASFHISNHNDNPNPVTSCFEIEELALELDNIERRKSLSGSNVFVANTARSIKESSWARISSLIKEEDQDQLNRLDQQNGSTYIQPQNTISYNDANKRQPKGINVYQKPKDNYKPNNFQQMKTTHSINLQQIKQAKLTASMGPGTFKDKQTKLKQDYDALNQKMKPTKMISKSERENLSRNLKILSELVMNTEIAADNFSTIQNHINNLKNLIKKC